MGKVKTRHALIIGSVIIVSFLSFNQIKFTWHYILGNYFYLVDNDYSQSVEHYSYLFANPRMQQNPRFSFAADAYAYGRIKAFSEPQKNSADNDLKKLCGKFPDNLYLNYFGGSDASRDFNIKNLDSVAFLCLKDKNLNNLSFRVIRHFFNPEDMTKKWRNLLSSFLRWQGNESLERKLTLLFPGKKNRITIEKYSETCFIPGMLYGFYLSRLEQEQMALKKLNSHTQKMLPAVTKKLEQNRVFRASMARQRRLSQEISLLQKTYKSGYPPLAARLKELRQLNRETAGMKQAEFTNLADRISKNMASAEKKIAYYGKVLSVFSAQSESKTDRIPQLVTGSCLPADSRLRTEELETLIHGDSVSIFYADFNNSNWKKLFSWRSAANYRPYSNGSFYGAACRGTFTMICFYSEKNQGHAAGWGGVFSKEKMAVEPGVYLIEFSYRTAELEREPLYFSGPGIRQSKLPLTGGHWFKVISVLSFDRESKTGYIRPLLRIFAPGIMQVADFSIRKSRNQPFGDLKEMVVVSTGSQKKND